MSENNAEKKTPTRPLPKLTELDTGEFWQATANKEFRYQQCANCGTIVWHPRARGAGAVPSGARGGGGRSGGQRGLQPRRRRSQCGASRHQSGGSGHR